MSVEPIIERKLQELEHNLDGKFGTDTFTWKSRTVTLRYEIHNDNPKDGDLESLKEVRTKHHDISEWTNHTLTTTTPEVAESASNEPS